MTKADDAKNKREALKRRYGTAFKRASEILFEEDLVGINFEVNTDEYEPEVGAILPRLHDCQSVADVNRLIHDEFVKWFDAGIAGSPEKYQSIAKRFWDEIIPLLNRSLWSACSKAARKESCGNTSPERQTSKQSLCASGYR